MSLGYDWLLLKRVSAWGMWLVHSYLHWLCTCMWRVLYVSGGSGLAYVALWRVTVYSSEAVAEMSMSGEATKVKHRSFALLGERPLVVEGDMYCS